MDRICMYSYKEPVKRKLTGIGAKNGILLCLNDNGGQVPMYYLQAHPREMP